MSQNWSTVVTDWQGVDSEPTTGSQNLVTSGGVKKQIADFSIFCMEETVSYGDSTYDSLAGLYSALFAFVCTLVRPFGGYLADRKRPMALLQWVFVAIVIFAIWIMLSFHNQFMFIAGIVLVGLSAGIGNGVVFKMVPYVSQGNTGAVTGFVGAVGGLGGFFPPLIIGYIYQWTGSYELGIALLALTSAICWFALWKHYIHGDVHIVK